MQGFILTCCHLAISPSVRSRDPAVLLARCPRDGYSGSRATPGSALESGPLTSDDCRPVRIICKHINSDKFTNNDEDVPIGTISDSDDKQNFVTVPG